MILVVDASVAVKWFVPEPASEHADALRDHSGPLVAPDLIVLEVGNVLARAARRGDLSLADAEEAMRRLAEGSPLRFPRASEFAAEAMAIAIHHGGTLYDGVYVAVAKSLDAPLVTDDREMTRVARAAGVRALRLGEDVQPPPR